MKTQLFFAAAEHQIAGVFEASTIKDEDMNLRATPSGSLLPNRLEKACVNADTSYQKTSVYYDSDIMTPGLASTHDRAILYSSTQG